MQVEREKDCSVNMAESQNKELECNLGNEGSCGSSLSLSDSSDDSSSSFQDDDEDSLELSESESITDVTPLNSPYCDSPMPAAKDRLQTDEGSKDAEKLPPNNRSEMNVLMQAIEKLEVEKNRKTRKQRSGMNDFANRRMEPENQRLFKQAISQQNRAKKAGQDRLCRRSTVINRYKISLDAESPLSLSAPC